MFALVVAFAACSDDKQCGPGAAPLELAMKVGTSTVTYGNFVSSANNDCNPPGSSGPISLTVDGTQTDPPTPSDFFITFCLPRPSELESAPTAITDTSLIQIININANIDNCTLSVDRNQAMTGTADFDGLCDGGTHPDGYAMALATTVGGTRTCDMAVPPTMEPVMMEIIGSVAVSAGQ